MKQEQEIKKTEPKAETEQILSQEDPLELYKRIQRGDKTLFTCVDYPWSIGEPIPEED